jgi:8-oxo-dGTP diphosphatase
MIDIDIEQFVRPSVTVDVVIMTVVEGVLQLLLIRRGGEPYRGALALPGGFVRVGDAHADKGEALDAAAARELYEETSLRQEAVHLEQIGAFGTPGRDPRTRVVTVAYLALVRPELVPFVRGGSDAAEALWVDARHLDDLQLAFDHRGIIDAALAHMRRMIDRSPLAFHLVPETFSASELRTVHEALLETTLDAGNFHRKLKQLLERGVVEEAPGKRVTARKPARVYRFRRYT